MLVTDEVSKVLISIDVNEEQSANMLLILVTDEVLNVYKSNVFKEDRHIFHIRRIEIISFNNQNII